jgi:hypothetical protein
VAFLGIKQPSVSFKCVIFQNSRQVRTKDRRRNLQKHFPVQFLIFGFFFSYLNLKLLMELLRTILVCIVLISCCKASTEYEEKGFGVGLVRKPTNCKRVTKRGDHISVKYNGTFIDGSTYVPTRYVFH